MKVLWVFLAETQVKGPWNTAGALLRGYAAKALDLGRSALSCVRWVVCSAAEDHPRDTWRRMASPQGNGKGDLIVPLGAILSRRRSLLHRF